MAQNQTHRWWVIVLLTGFLGKYFYGAFPNIDYESHPELMNVYYRDFFPLTDLNPKMDARNFWYLVGERFLDMVQFAILCRFLWCWQTIFVWLLSVGYIFDFMLTYHTSYYGEVYMAAIGLIGILSIITIFIRWKTQY